MRQFQCNNGVIKPFVTAEQRGFLVAKAFIDRPKTTRLTCGVFNLWQKACRFRRNFIVATLSLAIMKTNNADSRQTTLQPKSYQTRRRGGRGYSIGSLQTARSCRCGTPTQKNTSFPSNSKTGSSQKTVATCMAGRCYCSGKENTLACSGVQQQIAARTDDKSILPKQATMQTPMQSQTEITSASNIKGQFRLSEKVAYSQ